MKTVLRSAAIAGLFAAVSAHAQQVPADGAAEPAALQEARARQTALFEAMRADPDNLDLMFAYALLSIQIGDFEQAIATLERMLIFNQNLPRVKLELAVAYFRLGAYETARFYLEDALGSNPPPAVQERIAVFLAQIDERTRTHRFTGILSVGGIYSSNATLGPDDRNVIVTFGDGASPVTAQIPADAVASDDFGARLSLGVSHIYDLGRPNQDAWVTRAGYIGQRYASERSGEFDMIEASTGPQLALDDDQFGLKARPFLRGGYVASARNFLYWNAGGGLELSNTFGPQLSGFARINADWREYDEDDRGFDGLYGFTNIGAVYSGFGDTTLTATAILETDRADESFYSNHEFGLRLSAARDVAAPGAITEAGPWSLTAYAQLTGRFYDDPDPRVDPNKTRRDIDARIGGRVFVPVTPSVGIALDASYFDRSSNIRNYELDNIEIGVSAIARF
jgi:hypothetical protein